MALAFSLPAHAGGLDEVAPDTDPCPDAPLVQPIGMTDAMFANWQAVRAMTCGTAIVAPRAFFDRRTGEQLTDDEILRRIFAEPAVVPLPASAWLLLAGIGALVWRSK